MKTRIDEHSRQPGCAARWDRARRRRNARSGPGGLAAPRRLAVLPALLSLLASWLVLPLLVAPREAQAILASDGSPTATRQTTTQGLTTSELALYALLGQFRGFLGTPIDATHFITAQHIGIAAGDAITFAGGPNVGTYSIVGWTDDPGSDLRIVEIAGTFQDWVPLNGSGYEASKTATIFGRGGAPDSELFVGTELKGWTAANPDGAISWGRNVVTGTLNNNQIYARFEINGLPQEAGLTAGDSGGPWFAADGQGLMRLIGVSFGATGPYQLDVAGAPSGSYFEAALFDLGGLWVGAPGNAVFIPENPVNVPGVGVASRISDRIGWISTLIDLSTEDTDRDGIANQFDNCPWVANANQLDNGGLGSSTAPDGIGNACQCGDVTGEGQVNDTDAAFIKRHALGLSAALFLVPDNCDVTGDGACNGTDATLIRHAAAGTLNPLFGQHCPNAMP
ncbi:MAG: thrombospondin type 3 repeat-containing protein [Deltaproteobacteria bacterium]|nr:thrombospondin type 3 repeat-containing protein [Deltaproteobacteria bacterium]